MMGCVCGFAVLAVSALADGKKTGYDASRLPLAAAKTGVAYATDVQPIFEKSCYPCHGPKTPKPKGGLRLDSPSMTSIDTTKISHDDGVEVSGLIGAQALFQVVMHIDYRDNLVWCEYTPKK